MAPVKVSSRYQLCNAAVRHLRHCHKGTSHALTYEAIAPGPPEPEQALSWNNLFLTSALARLKSVPKRTAYNLESQSVSLEYAHHRPTGLKQRNRCSSPSHPGEGQSLNCSVTQILSVSV